MRKYDNFDTAVFSIEGGIGHHFNMSVVFRKYKEKHPKRKIVVLGPWLYTLHRNKYIDPFDPGDYLVRESIAKKGRFISHNLSVYRDSFHIRLAKDIPGAIEVGFEPEDGPFHIKQILGIQCGVRIEREDKLDYFPTSNELRDAKDFKRNMCEGKLLGIVQCEGTGFRLNSEDPMKNALSVLKQIPKETANAVLEETANDIFWVQVRLPNEEDLNADYELVDIHQRPLFALEAVADIGFGTDSFSQHLIAGAYGKPFIMVTGRSSASAYAHPTCITVENIESCPYGISPCESPQIGVDRVCDDLYCMNSIKPEQIIKEIKKAVKRIKEK